MIDARIIWELEKKVQHFNNLSQQLTSLSLSIPEDEPELRLEIFSSAAH